MNPATWARVGMMIRQLFLVRNSQGSGMNIPGFTEFTTRCGTGPALVSVAQALAVMKPTGGHKPEKRSF